MTIAVDLGRKATKQTNKSDTILAKSRILYLFQIPFNNFNKT